MTLWIINKNWSFSYYPIFDLFRPVCVCVCVINDDQNLLFYLHTYIYPTWIVFEFECARTRTQNNMCPCYVVRLFCCKVAKEVDTIAIDIDICHSICRSWTRCTQVGSGGIDVKEQIFTTTTVTVAAIRLCCALFMFDSSFVVYILTKSSFFVCVCVCVSLYTTQRDLFILSYLTTRHIEHRSSANQIEMSIVYKLAELVCHSSGGNANRSWLLIGQLAKQARRKYRPIGIMPTTKSYLASEYYFRVAAIVTEPHFVAASGFIVIKL